MLLRTRIDTRGPASTRYRPGLDPAPHAEARRISPEQRLGQGEAAVGEQVAAAGADHAGLGVGVEREAPRHRPLVDAAFEEQRKGRAAAAGAADRLAALGGQRYRDRPERGYPNASRDLAAAGAADRRAGAQRSGQAAAKNCRSAALPPGCRRGFRRSPARPGPAAAQQRPGRQLQPIEASFQGRLRQALLRLGGRRAMDRHRRRRHARQRPLVELRDGRIEDCGRLGGDLCEPAAPGSGERSLNVGRSPGDAHRIWIDRHCGGARGPPAIALGGRASAPPRRPARTARRRPARGPRNSVGTIAGTGLAATARGGASARPKVKASVPGRAPSVAARMVVQPTTAIARKRSEALIARARSGRCGWSCPSAAGRRRGGARSRGPRPSPR